MFSLRLTQKYTPKTANIVENQHKKFQTDLAGSKLSQTG